MSINKQYSIIDWWIGYTKFSLSCGVARRNCCRKQKKKMFSL